MHIEEVIETHLILLSSDDEDNADGNYSADETPDLFEVYTTE